MSKPFRVPFGVLLGVSVVFTAFREGRAEDVYYSVPISALKITEGKMPDVLEIQHYWDPRRALHFPYVVLDGPGEAYPSMREFEPASRNIVVRVDAPRKITGRLFWPNSDLTGHVKLKFEIEKPSEITKTQFLETKLAIYNELSNRALAGAPWFRHQTRALRKQLGPARSDPNNFPWAPGRINDFDSTYDLLSGGRAITENLQLERALTPLDAKGDDVAIDSLTGITVAEIDWKPLIKGLSPSIDPLAKLIPSDQHVVFFPTFDSFVKVGDKLSEQGALVMGLAEPRSQDQEYVAKYERQLGLSIHGLGRIVGPHVIKSVALTGSDPYFASGTDVALVFEAEKPEMVANLLMAQVAINSQKIKGAEPVSEEVGGLRYRGIVSPDRKMSSYSAVLPDAVLLTNSKYQIERFSTVLKKETPTIAELEEFTFFRSRYPREDKDESAFLFLSDATIRRWCGPRWRIGASRELRDAAVMADVQAANMDALVKREAKGEAIQSDLPLAVAGELTLAPTGVRSSNLGDLEFMTPVAQLKLDKVTKAEADAYERWRDGYQQNWRWAFDPIGIRISIKDNQLAGDLTVMPLIAGSEYRQYIDISGRAKIAPDAGDRHDTIFHWILSIDRESETARSSRTGFGMFVPGINLDPLSWVGTSVAIYVEDDPIWKELADCKDDTDRYKLIEKRSVRMPIAVRAEVASGIKLAAFLAALRTYVDTTAPGMLSWEVRNHKEQPYVVVALNRNQAVLTETPEDFEPKLYYLASRKCFLLTLSEDVLKKAIERELARASSKNAEPAADSAPHSPEARPWLAESIAAQVDPRFLGIMFNSMGASSQFQMQSQSWNNLPILNEWRKRYPEEEPVALHERIWNEKLVCPGGGKYVWNEEWQTMESTVYGHPGEPKTGPAAPPNLLNFKFANFGITFEEQGLRAKMVLETAAPAKKE